MPPNAKKRKAAQRKKGRKTAHVDAPTNSQGNGGGGRDEHNHTSHDEKDSGTGDLSSPSSREPSVIGDSSSWSAGADNPMEGESENSGFAKPVEQTENRPSVTAASEDVRVEYVKVIEGDDGSSSGSSSDEESRSAQIATAVGDLGGPVDYTLVTGKTVDPSEQVDSSSQLSVTSVVVPEAVTSATVIEPEASGDSIVKKPEEVVTSVPESEEAAPSTLKATEEVVTSLLESERAVPSLKEDEDKSSSAAEEAPSEKPRAEADFPEIGNRESTDNEADKILWKRQMGLAPLPVRATSWKSCCGLFELIGSSNR